DEAAVAGGGEPAGQALLVQQGGEGGGRGPARLAVEGDVHADTSSMNSGMAPVSRCWAAMPATAGDSRKPCRNRPLANSVPPRRRRRGRLSGKAGRASAPVSSTSASPKAGCSA